MSDRQLNPQIDAFVDAYSVLGVAPDAGQATLKQAHRRLAWQHHPDRLPPERRSEATLRIQQINVAYGLVRTPAARARYDALRAAPRTPARVGESDWDLLMRQAGRWAGQWWRRNEGPLRRAAKQARRRYTLVTGTVVMVAYAWLGTVLAVAAGQFVAPGNPLPTIVGGVGGALAGAVHRRDRLRSIDGHPPMRYPWLPVTTWLLTLAASLAWVAS
ncbi:MAG: J domain-containing protein [Egibacteraceae bacterium]